MGRLVFLFLMGFLLNSLKAASQLDLKEKTDSSDKKISLKILPQNFYNKQLSFFCKKELQVQKLSSLPLFFRLGSKEYVDYLEKKPNSFIGKRE
jgi:hypothetical protein